jgi:hypothetical protein
MNRSLASGLLLTALAAPPPATHVVAVSGEVPIARPPVSDFLLGGPDVTTAAPGEFVVAWTSIDSEYRGSQEISFGAGFSGRRVGLHALPLAPEFPIVPEAVGLSTDAGPSLAGNASGRFVVSWQVSEGGFGPGHSLVQMQRFSADTEPVGEGITTLYASPVGPPRGEGGNPVAMDPLGRSVVAWLQPLPVQTEGFSTLRIQFFDPAGRAVTSRFPVTGRALGEASPALAMDGRGNSIVVYRSQPAAAGRPTGLAFRRYDSKGRPLGDEVQVSSPGSQIHPTVAASAIGSFVVAWADPVKGIEAQLFDGGGRPKGSAFQVASLSRHLEDVPDVAMNSRGGFVVVWEGLDLTGPPHLLGRAFSSTGVPQGDDTEITNLPFGLLPKVALAENGTFLVTWASGQTSALNQINASAFRALSNRDRCVYRGSTFLCGSATGELTPLLQLGNGIAAGDVPLLADVDGDGADDPCIRRGNVFFCALSGSGGQVQTLSFGAASQPPLLGDVNGDGHADPCVRRGRFFLCDTAHDGGAVAVQILVGQPGDVPLLGDVDGDGRADPCVVSSGHFLCNVSHDGTLDLLRAEDFEPGDVPLLGDVDGDGVADFCVVRGTALLCDLDRRGKFTPQPLAIQPGDVVLLGNVDPL